MIRSVIVDDEKPSREVLSNYIAEYCPDVEVVATAGSVKSAYKAIKKADPDLIFLDIELGDGRGFDLLNLFPGFDFRVIFVTAYSEHAVKAFRFSAIDYLLKPVKIDELKEAIDKVRKFSSSNLRQENFQILFNNLSVSAKTLQNLVIPHVRGHEVLKISDIIMCRADGYCTNFHLLGNKKVVSSKNLKHYEELLAGYNFLRVHHSYIVNLNYVNSYTKQGEILLEESNRAALGDAYKEAFINRITGKQVP
ncbi:MAG TPA: LytTR family DNA-binding domain-containing protein [Bacteroidales bacterium]|nr:LytTR family DNA-binding domain-containing protein [Bacteroidales bacterium]